VYHFSAALITCAQYFCFARQYPPCIVLFLALLPIARSFFFFVSHTNILCAFHSTHYTMPNFSIPPPRTKTLRAPLTKLLREKFYPYCTHNYHTPLRCANTAHTTHTIFMSVHTTHTSYAYAHCAMLNLARAPTHKHFFARHQNLVRTPTH
jgi:hypothetical protein